MLPLPKIFTGDDPIVDPLNRLRTNIKDRTPMAGRNVRLEETPNGFVIHANVPPAHGGSSGGGFGLFKVVGSGNINLGGYNYKFYACNKRIATGYETDVTIVRGACYFNKFPAQGTAFGVYWRYAANGGIEYPIAGSSPLVKWTELLNEQVTWQTDQEIQAGSLGYSLGQITAGPYAGEEIMWVDNTPQPSWNHPPTERCPVCSDSNPKLWLGGQITTATIPNP